MPNQTDKVTITNEQLNLFCYAGKAYLATPEEEDNQSVLKVAIEDLMELALKKLKKVERSVEALRVKYAKKTATKHVDRDKNGNFQFTEDDMRKLQEEADAINEQTVQLPYNIIDEKDVPAGLSYDQRMAFEGIVIPKKPRKFDNLTEDDTPEEENEE